MRKAVYLLSILAVIVLLGILAWNWFKDNKMSNFEESAELYVYPSDSADEVLETICTKCKVKDRASLERSFRSKEVSTYLKPGHYSISKRNSSVYVARMLNNGWQTPVRLTLSGNLRIKSNIAAKIASQMLVDSAEVHNALRNSELLKEYGVSPQTFYALFMPDTYEIWWTASVKDILDKQKEAVDAFWSEENLDKAEKLGLDRMKVSILASIVSAESNYGPELPKIAGVYLNRLKSGMPLQADPTVAFCFDYKLNRVLKKHLEVESPYNTYKHTGLPPGPICVPRKESLEAVLNPDFGGSWGKGNLYFCANPDFSGTHVFARSLGEHSANARAFQQELDRRAKAKR